LHLDGQIQNCKGFLDEADALVQNAVVGNGIGGIAGHEQSFDCVMRRKQVKSQIPPVHFGQDGIGEQQMNPFGR